MFVALHQWVFVAVLLLGSLTNQLAAQDKPADATDPAQPSPAQRDGYRLQDSDDIAAPLQPVVPRSAAIEARNKALAWYMTGRLLDSTHRNEPKKSLEVYRKAVKLDPEAIEIYRNLVPLEFAFDHIDEAIKYATKAVQLDPDDYEILQLLAQQAARTGQLPEAIKHLEQAVKSPRVDKHAPEFVVLSKSLGMLYSATGQKELAGENYEIVFDAVKNPEKYGMDQRSKGVLLSDPSTSYEQIGQVLMDANRLKLALEAFELAAQKSRLGAGSLSYNRAKILYLSEKYDDALVELEKYFAAQRTSKGRLPYQLLADILAKLNRSDELIRRLESMAESDAQNPHLQYFFADKLADLNELERARTIYDTMLRNGGDASGYAGLARVLRKMQKSAELLQALGRGLARGEEGVAAIEPEIKALAEDKVLMAQLVEAGRARAADDELKFEEALLLAKIAATLKDAETSGEFYSKAIALNRNGGRPSIFIQIDMADMYLQLRKYQRAVDAYNDVLASRQLNEAGQAAYYSKLAQALAFDNRTDEALEAIAKAIAIDDDKAGFRFYEAWIYSHAKRWDDAIVKFEQLIKDFPDDKGIIQQCQFTLSNVYVQKGEMQKGEDILEKVLEVSPESSQVNNDLGYLWADQGKNLDRAEKMIRKALAAEPDNGAYLDSLGWVLFKLGKVEEAIPPLEQATQKSQGGDGTIWDHLGDVYLKAMRTEKAVEAWQTALKHLQDDSAPDAQLIERINEKLKQHQSGTKPKPAEKGSP